MNKKVLIFNISIACISLLLLLRGIYLIDNSGFIATELIALQESKSLTFQYGDSKTTLNHFIDVVKLKGIIFSLFSLCGFLICIRNINKEMSTK